jgi:hypothetical protein
MIDKATLAKDWGKDHFVYGDNTVTIRRLEIKKDGKSTFGRFHLHEHKYNRFYVESGLIKVFRKKGEYIQEFVIGPDRTHRKVDIFPGEKHRFEALEESIVYEIYWTYCDPNDIVREH